MSVQEQMTSRHLDITTNENVQKLVLEEPYWSKLFYTWTICLFDHTDSNFFSGLQLYYDTLFLLPILINYNLNKITVCKSSLTGMEKFIL